jgi:L-threonylcarbamoyladenylate synthase
VRRIDAATEEVGRIATEFTEVVEAGGTVIWPTDTVYGIGCDPAQPDAIARIFALKGRPDYKPLALHLASVAELLEYAGGNPLAALAARHFLPGPLTIVVRRPDFVDERVSAGLPTVGLRVPAQRLCLALLERSGPLAATSANRSGSPAYLGGPETGGLPEADLFVFDGPTPLRTESTIIDVSHDELRLVREGAISQAMLELYLDRPVRPGNVLRSPESEG